MKPALVSNSINRVCETKGLILVLYINPFDHPLIWEGHGSVIDELKTDLNGTKPSLIICSVGGGGLLLGILNGLKRNGWNDVPGKFYRGYNIRALRKE